MAELLGICADDIKLSQLEEFPGTAVLLVMVVVSHSQATPTLIFVLLFTSVVVVVYCTSVVVVVYCTSVIVVVYSTSVIVVVYCTSVVVVVYCTSVISTSVVVEESSVNEPVPEDTSSHKGIQ